MRTVAIDMAERAEIEGAESLHAIGRGLHDIARGMDLIVKHDEDALPSRVREAGHLQCVHEIGAGIAAERARRALRSDQYDGLIDAKRQIEEERGLLKRRRAVRDNKTGEFRILTGRAVNERAQFEPVPGADRGRADLPKRDRHGFGNLPRFRKAVEQCFGCQLLSELGIIEYVEAAGAERRNRPARPDNRNARKRCRHGISSSRPNQNVMTGLGPVTTTSLTLTRRGWPEQVGLRR